MKYLTFLDYPTLEATGANYEAKLKEKDREIAHLREQIAINNSSIGGQSDKIIELEKKIEWLMKKAGESS
jgi:hypothetical protein